MYYSGLELRSISTELTVLQVCIQVTHCRPGNEAIHSAENLVCGTIGYTRDARLMIRPLSASFHLRVTTYHSHHSSTIILVCSKKQTPQLTAVFWRHQTPSCSLIVSCPDLPSLKRVWRLCAET